MTERNQLIDNLRGFSILVIILTHTTAFFPSDKIAYTLWNLSHFAVPIFLFCSAYLFLQKSSDKPPHFFSYLKKRVVRLLVPYYIYLFFFLIALFFVSPHVVSFTYIWQSILLIGGTDINWLVLLFLYITVLLPFFTWALKHSKFLFWFYFALALGSNYLLLFYQFPVSYKFVMWLPWSTMFYFTWFYIKYENKKNILSLIFLLTLSMFISSHIVQSQLHHSTVLIHNKYPPNVFYLSYGVSILLLLSFFHKYIFSNKFVIKTVHFFSKFSYSLFFLHYIILTVFSVFIQTLHIHWFLFFSSVLVFTIFLQYFYIFIRKNLQNR